MKFINNFLHIQEEMPKKCTIDLTYSCPLKCVTCKRGNRVLYKNELELKDYERIFDELKENGFTDVIFSGGEPFIKRDIYEIIKACIYRNMYVSICSNGYLIKNSSVQILKKLGITSITLSLNSLDQKTHDYTRGVTGSYKRIMSAIDTLKTDKINITILTILLKQNIQKIPELIQWSKEKNFQIRFQILVSPDFMFYTSKFSEAIQQHSKEFNPFWFKNNENWINNTEEMEKIIDQIIHMKEKNFPILNSVKQLYYFKKYYYNPIIPLPFKCNVSHNNLSIDPYGNVRLCFAMAPIGNIKNYSLEKIRNSREAKSMRKIINSCHLNCKLMECNY